MMHEDGVRAMMLTLRANPTVKPPTPSPVTRGLVSTPNVPSREKPPSVYIAMAADFEANLQTCLGVFSSVQYDKPTAGQRRCRPHTCSTVLWEFSLHSRVVSKQC